MDEKTIRKQDRGRVGGQVRGRVRGRVDIEKHGRQIVEISES